MSYQLTGTTDDGYACYDATGPDEVTEPIDAPETDDAEWTNCDECLESITFEMHDANNGLCSKCKAAWDAAHAVCSECDDEFELSEMHATHTTLCEGCGDAKAEELATEALDAAKEELQELVDELVGNDDLADLLKAIKALKKITG
jgi:hypothetical protein